MPNLQRQQQQQDRTRHPVRHLRGPPDADAKQMEQEAMTPTQRAAMEQALEALEEIHPGNMTPMAEAAWNKAITALRAALAKQPAEQEPVAFSQFLTDVVTAAGLLSHGKTDKALATRISGFAFHLRTAPHPAKPAEREPLTLWTEAQHARAYRNSPELHKDVKSLAAFKRVAKEIAAMYGITGETK